MRVSAAGGLALAHARSGDAAMISGDLGHTDRFDEAVVEWAAACTDHSERAHARPRAGIDGGRVAAEMGV
jgi:hypothetical protein